MYTTGNLIIGTVIVNSITEHVNVSNNLLNINDIYSDGFKPIGSTNFVVRHSIYINTDTRLKKKKLAAILKRADLQVRHNVFYKVYDHDIISLTNLKSAITRSLNNHGPLSINNLSVMDLTRYRQIPAVTTPMDYEEFKRDLRISNNNTNL